MADITDADADQRANDEGYSRIDRKSDTRPTWVQIDDLASDIRNQMIESDISRLPGLMMKLGALVRENVSTSPQLLRNAKNVILHRVKTGAVSQDKVYDFAIACLTSAISGDEKSVSVSTAQLEACRFVTRASFGSLFAECVRFLLHPERFVSLTEQPRDNGPGEDAETQKNIIPAKQKTSKASRNKLNDVEARLIKHAKAGGKPKPYKKLAEDFGISQGAMNALVRSNELLRSWKEDDESVDPKGRKHSTNRYSVSLRDSDHAVEEDLTPLEQEDAEKLLWEAVWDLPADKQDEARRQLEQTTPEERLGMAKLKERS